MPRSFLIKKYLTNKKPNYGVLDSKTDASFTGVQAIVSLHQSPCLIHSSPPQPQCGFPGFLSSCCLHLPMVAGQPPRPGVSSLGSLEQEYPLSPAPGSLSDSHSVVEPQGTIEPFKTLEHHNFLPPPLLAPCLPPTPSRPPSHPPGLPPGLAPGLGFLPGVGQERFECFDCHKAFFTFSGLAKHRQLHCDWQCHKYFSCKYCDKEYVSLGALKMHIRTHTLPCVCRLCGKAFSRPWLLQGHIRTHTGEKPFSCPHCSRAFADRSNLRAHLQTHSDVKKYQCSSCSKTFSRISLLAKHQEAGCLLH